MDWLGRIGKSRCGYVAVAVVLAATAGAVLQLATAPPSHADVGTAGQDNRGTGRNRIIDDTVVRPDLTAIPVTLAFGDVPLGASNSLTARFVNVDVDVDVITAITPPTGPFTASSGLPTVGTVIEPGEDFYVSVTYTPTAVGTDTVLFSISGSNGTGEVTLTGNGRVGLAYLTITPPSLYFGELPVGLSATRTLTVKNSGDVGLTITEVAPPALPFVVTTLLDPASSTATALGGTGSGLGFAGLTGVAVIFSTYPQPDLNRHNFIEVVTSTAGGHFTRVGWWTNVPDFRDGPHSVMVAISGNTLVVTVDGTGILGRPGPVARPDSHRRVHRRGGRADGCARHLGRRGGHRRAGRGQRSRARSAAGWLVGRVFDVIAVDSGGVRGSLLGAVSGHGWCGRHLRRAGRAATRP